MGPISSTTSALRPPRKEWTVLYWLNGNNDLEPHLVRNLMDTEKVGSSDQVNIVAQLSRPSQEVVHGPDSKKRTGLDGDWTGMRRYYINKGGSRTGLKNKAVEIQESSPNHGDPATLADFLKWGIEQYPAQRYMVVLGDHGKGFQGMGFDYLHRDVLDLGELKSALSQVQSQTGVKPDVLVMDACEMGAVEVAYQLRDQARYLVASEEIVGAVGLPHREVLSQLTADPARGAEEIAREWVEISAWDTESRVEKNKPEAAEQLAALDLGQMQVLGKALGQLSQTLATSTVPARELKKWIRQTQHFNLDHGQKPDSDYRDLRHFCSQLSQNCQDPAVLQAVARVEAALERAVLHNHAQGEADVEDAHGLSVYLPAGPIRDPKQVLAPNGGKPVTVSAFRYRDSDFDRDTGWSDWLEKKFKSA